MIATLIFLILIVIFLAFFIGFNIQNNCNLWFFTNYTDVPVVLLIFIAFAAGVAIALLIVLFAKLRSPSKKEYVEVKSKEEKKKDKELKEKIKDLEGKKKLSFKKNKNNSENTAATDTTQVSAKVEN